MSLHDLATTSFPASHDESLPPSTLELRNVLLDHEADDQLNRTFPHGSIYLPQLQHLGYIAQNITRIEWELDRHQEEERRIYGQVMTNDTLQNTLQPIVHRYRQRTRAKGFHPYTNQPLSTTSTPPTTSPKSQKSELSSQSSRSSKKSKSIASPAPSSSSYESGMSIVRAFLDEERQREATIQTNIKVEQQQTLRNMQALPGSSLHPIEIEKDDKDDFPPLIPYKRRMSTIPTYRPTCEKCGQLGHEEPTCTTPLRKYVKCEYCAWLKQSQRLCMHFDMSPKRLRYLRLRMRMPENPDYQNRSPQ